MAEERGLKKIARLEWQKASKALLSQKIVLEGETWDLGMTPLYSPRFKTSEGFIEGSEITQKRILREIAKGVEYVPNGTQIKVERILGLLEEDLSLAFRRIKKDHRDGVMRDFQLILLSGAVYTNKAYKRMKKKESAKCTFCNEEQQDFTHLFISCNGVNKLRTEIATGWPGEKMTSKRWFLGCSSSNEDLERSKDYIAKEINHYVFQTNWANGDLSTAAFKNRIFAKEEVEEAVASKTNMLFDFQVKWENLRTLLP